MTEYFLFMEVLRSMGIQFGTPDNLNQTRGQRRHGDEPIESIYQITVSQAIFCFDKDKKYIGVVADEMGFFEKRVN